MEDLVAVARIVKPRGLKGEVFADVLTDFPERFDGLADVTAVMPGDERRKLAIEGFWFQKGRIVLKFAGVDTPEAAEELRGADICIPESAAVELEEDEFFEWQLIGCSVETVGGQPLGVVSELMRTGGTDLLTVDSSDRQYLIPFAGSICVEIDLPGKLIKVDPPEGLLDF